MMKKVHSYLKGLAETRARAHGEVERNEALLAELDESLDAAEKALARVQELRQKTAARLEQAKAELNACDTLIRKYDKRIDPSRIEPIHEWRGRYGKRGALQEYVEQALRDALPDALSTRVLSAMCVAEFGLQFTTHAERMMWHRNTLRTKLKTMAQKGTIARVLGPNEVEAHWRWIGTGHLYRGSETRSTWGRG